MFIWKLIDFADSEDETRDRDDEKPLDHDEEIDMDDYEYCPDEHTMDIN